MSLLFLICYEIKCKFNIARVKFRSLNPHALLFWDFSITPIKQRLGPFAGKKYLEAKSSLSVVIFHSLKLFHHVSFEFFPLSHHHCWWLSFLEVYTDGAEYQCCLGREDWDFGSGNLLGPQ